MDKQALTSCPAQPKPMLLIESGTYNYLKSNGDRTNFNPIQVIPSRLPACRDWLKWGLWNACKQLPLAQGWSSREKLRKKKKNKLKVPTMDLHSLVSFHNRTTVNWRRKEFWDSITHFQITFFLTGLKPGFWNAWDWGVGGGRGVTGKSSRCRQVLQKKNRTWGEGCLFVFLRREVWDQDKCLINSVLHYGIIPELLKKKKKKQWHIVPPTTMYLLPWVFRKIGRYNLSRFECVNKEMRTSLLCCT